MAVPTVATYSADAIYGAHLNFSYMVDTEGTAGSIKIRSATDMLLAQVPLAYPCGEVNPATGQLVLTIAGPDASAAAGGTAAYAELCDAAGVVLLSLPAQAGGSAVSGYLVVNTLSVVAGSAFEVLSAVIG